VREVAGDAAWRLSPDDADAWQMAMAELAAHPRRRDKMRAAGLARAADFTWRRAAEATIGVYDRVVTQQKGR
jgi:glycosyltransferase involved in cell wall biosynthesis